MLQLVTHETDRRSGFDSRTGHEMSILAIDPGNELSAFVLYDERRRMVIEKGKQPNMAIRYMVRNSRADQMAIEMIASYGMPVGREVFETCLWIGRFIELWPPGPPPALVYRRDVKLHLCGSSKAKDGNVRAALIDRWGGKHAAIGTKKAPGPLHGFAGDYWQALAVAVTFCERSGGVNV